MVEARAVPESPRRGLLAAEGGAGASTRAYRCLHQVPVGWPEVAPEMPLSTSPGCIYKDPCAWDTKWYGVGCVDPCYAPTDGDNCVFGRVTQVSLRQLTLTLHPRLMLTRTV